MKTRAIYQGQIESSSSNFSARNKPLRKALRLIRKWQPREVRLGQRELESTYDGGLEEIRDGMEPGRRIRIARYNTKARNRKLAGIQIPDI